MMQETTYVPLIILGVGALLFIFLAERGWRYIYRRFFSFRPLSAEDVFRKLGSVELGSRVIHEDCLSDLPGKTIDDLELELKRFIAVLMVNRPTQYVLSNPMKAVWQSLVRDHETYDKLQKSLLGSHHTFTVSHAAPGGPVDVSTPYKAFHKDFMDLFGTPDPVIWPHIYRHGKGLEDDEVLLISVGRDNTRKGPGARADHNVYKTVGLRQTDIGAG